LTPTPTPYVPFLVLYVEPNGNSLNDFLKTEAEKARAIGLRPFVEFYAEWCPACKEIKRDLKNGDVWMADAFAGVYLISIDIDKWEDYLPDSGFEFEYIPVFFRFDKKGQPTYDWIDGSAWGENTPENMHDPLKEFFNRK